MKSDQSAFVRVGDLLGHPPTVDPTRPATMGGATPRFPGVHGQSMSSDFPLFWVHKRCVSCERAFEGWSTHPQYDDAPPHYGMCDRCIDAHTKRRREREQAERTERKLGRAAVSRPAEAVARRERPAPVARREYDL